MMPPYCLFLIKNSSRDYLLPVMAVLQSNVKYYQASNSTNHPLQKMFFCSGFTKRMR